MRGVHGKSVQLWGMLGGQVRSSNLICRKIRLGAEMTVTLGCERGKME